MKMVKVEVMVVTPDDYDPQDLKESLTEIVSMMDAFHDLNVTVIREGAIDSVR